MADYCAHEYVAWPLPTRPEMRRDRIIGGGEYVQLLGVAEYREWYGFLVPMNHIDDWVNRHFKKTGEGTWEARDYPGFYIFDGPMQIRSYRRHSQWVDVQIVGSKRS